MAVAESSIYTKGLHVNSNKEWYHGELTREQAEKTLRDNGSDCFLIRESKGSLVLSLIKQGETLHYKITHQLGWYTLSGSSQQFKKLNELVDYISTHSIKPTKISYVYVYLREIDHLMNVELRRCYDLLYSEFFQHLP